MCFVDIGEIVNHHCLEMIVCSVDIGGIVDHHCLEAVVYFVDIGGVVDHHCLEVIASFVDINRLSHTPIRPTQTRKVGGRMAYVIKPRQM